MSGGLIALCGLGGTALMVSVIVLAGREDRKARWTKAEQDALAGIGDLERLTIVAARPLQPTREMLPQRCTDPDCLHHLSSHDLRHPLLACITTRCRCRSFSPARL